MATRITKKNWQDDTTIISDEIFNSDLSYEITYQGKSKISDIINAQPLQIYKSIFGNNNDNKLYFGDNLDVLKLLVDTSKFKEKIKLIYIDPPLSYGEKSFTFRKNN